MKINIKARLKNKTFLISAAALIVSIIFKILAIFEIVPRISESELIEIVGLGINLLAFMGVVTDPTTCGLADSERAMTYYTNNDIRCSEEVKSNE